MVEATSLVQADSSVKLVSSSQGTEVVHMLKKLASDHTSKELGVKPDDIFAGRIEQGLVKPGEEVANEQELAALHEDIADTEEIKDSKASDLAEEQALEVSLEKNCVWVESHFDARREKRKAEIDGLVEAKNSLAGIGSDDDDDWQHFAMFSWQLSHFDW